MSFNFFTAFHRALQDPEGYFSFQKEMNSKAVEQTFFNSLLGKGTFDAVVLPENLSSTTYSPGNSVLRVRPLEIHDFIIPEPCQYKGDLDKIRKIISLHPVAYPDSEIPFNVGSETTPQAQFHAGQIVECFFLVGPQGAGKMRGLRYRNAKFTTVNNLDLTCLGGGEKGAKAAFADGIENPPRTDVPISKSSAQKIENFIQKIKKSPSFKGWSGQTIAGVVANAQAESAFKQLANGDSVKFYKGTSVSKKRMDNVRKRNINGKCSWGYWQLNICPDDGSGKQLADSKGIDTSTQEGKEAFVKLLENDEEQFKWVSQKMSAILSKGITSTDAYQAGYDITVNFERPQDRYNKGVGRGNLAASIYKKFQSILDA